ncbi:unnamed protein product [Adineta steineri]|uniref:Galactose-1-phosphate uridylyltransferase n=1 Tax=Adineta steineri TaxID=433720 RepID=A0A813P4B3_9BILA|nr:unnamed protein product [Adineta steineri]CAF0821485.1 unnamed protein product [Adineta steineri]CAF0861981.1 unnamed protein product [Adineta steineri]CAF3836176.1 unnamed protein product [Adineta steineri]
MWYRKHCFQIKESDKLAIENLVKYLNNARLSTNEICQEFVKKFDALFRLEEIYGALQISPIYLKKINKWLHNDETLIGQIKKQRIIKVYNRHTHEEMLYNYMRSQRPQSKNEQSADNYTLQMMEESKKNCDFCGNNYLSSTAEDSFGRLERSLSYTAANTFKYDRWHTLIVSRNHDTLHLTEDEIGDMFELAQTWFQKVYSIESMYTCPEMIWDAMPKSGASQVHTHLQVSLGMDIYYGNIERTRQGARHYAQINQGRNYFNDYLHIHHALDLTIPIGDAHIILHLTPVKDLEVMVLGEKLDKDFYKALHLIFRSFVDDLKEYSFSFGMYLPPMNETSSNGHEMPVVCRLVFRNPITNLRSDMNGLDLYTSSVIGKDRYVLYRQLKQGILKRQK